MKGVNLSIIIPTWNTADITLKCLKTIYKFLSPDIFEIIIVNNASTDDTVAEINKFIHSLKIENCKLIINASNLGFSKANNIGAKQAIGEYLFFLNSDMELVDKTLIDMVKYLESNNDAGIVGPKFLNPDLTIQGSVIPHQTALNAFKEYWLHNIGSYTKYTPTQNTPTSVPNISGGALLISKQNFDKIGGWDERYFFYYEDLELCRQIRNISKQIIFYPQGNVIHRHGASGAKIANSANQWRRLIPSSKIYHGIFQHYLIFFITWTSQKFYSFFTK